MIEKIKNELPAPDIRTYAGQRPIEHESFMSNYAEVNEFNTVVKDGLGNRVLSQEKLNKLDPEQVRVRAERDVLSMEIAENLAVQFAEVPTFNALESNPDQEGIGEEIAGAIPHVLGEFKAGRVTGSGMPIWEETARTNSEDGSYFITITNKGGMLAEKPYGEKSTTHVSEMTLRVDADGNPDFSNMSMRVEDWNDKQGSNSDRQIGGLEASVKNGDLSIGVTHTFLDHPRRSDGTRPVKRYGIANESDWQKTSKINMFKKTLISYANSRKLKKSATAGV